MLENLECLGSICRGWPNSFEILPCIAVSEASNQNASFYSDDDYISEAEYYVRIFTQTGKDGDTLAVKVEELMKDMGYTRSFTYEDDNPDIRQRLMRFKLNY